MQTCSTQAKQATASQLPHTPPAQLQWAQANLHAPPTQTFAMLFPCKSEFLMHNPQQSSALKKSLQRPQSFKTHETLSNLPSTMQQLHTQSPHQNTFQFTIFVISHVSPSSFNIISLDARMPGNNSLFTRLSTCCITSSDNSTHGDLRSVFGDSFSFDFHFETSFTKPTMTCF